MTVLYILIPVFLLGIIVAKTQNAPKYKYLFRNTILSQSQKYELAPVLRGRVYYPCYFYIPSLKKFIQISTKRDLLEYMKKTQSPQEKHTRYWMKTETMLLP